MERSRIVMVVLGLVVRGLVVLGLLAAGGCAPEVGVRPARVELALVLGPDGARVVSNERTAQTDPPVDGPALSWTLVGPSREVLASGRVADTREVRFEDLLSGEAHDTIPSDVGVVTVRIPDLGGTLVLRDPTGLVVARHEVLPSDRRVASLPLLARGDVLGPAVQVRGGAADGLDILFLPEGYTEAELDRFHDDVERVATALGAQPDYALFWEHIRVWRRDVRSRQTGAGTGGVAIDTAFDVAFGHAGTDRCAWFATSEGRAAAERLRRESRADAVAILVNSNTYGGCGQGGLSVNAVTSPAETAQVVAHELGHAFFGLADEYETPAAHIDDCVGGLDHAEVNVSDSATALPWADLVASSGGAVGAFEGAHYCAHGRFRPTHDCLMRNLYQRMCPVCLRHMARVLGVPAPSGGTGGTGGTDPGPGSGDGTPVGVPMIEVVNRTGAPIWARCAGTESTACTGWVEIADGRSDRIRTFDRRVSLDNQDALPGVSIDGFTFTAALDRVEIYANAANPLEPLSTGPGPDPRTDPPTDPDPPIDSDPPTDPALGSVAEIVDSTYDGSRVDVTFARVAGASEYWVYALAMTGASTWAGYHVERVADSGAGATESGGLWVSDLCDVAGPGTYGLVVQVMAADDDASLASQWLEPVGNLTCD